MTLEHHGVDPTDGGAARSLFSKFRALLEANTEALATMAAMERMLGGEYIFDRAFLEKSARAMTDCVHQAVYAVNAMTGNRHVALYDRFTAIAAAVEDILAGRPPADDGRLVRPIGKLRLEDRPKVGLEAAALGELCAQLGFAAPRGFALSRPAWEHGHITPAARQAIAEALVSPEFAPGPDGLAVTVAMAVGNAPAVRREIFLAAPSVDTALEALEAASRTLLGDLGHPETPLRCAASLIALPSGRLRGLLRTRCIAPDGRAGLRLDVRPAETPKAPGPDADSPRGPVTFFLERVHPYVSHFPRADTPDVLPQADASALAGQAMAAERLLGVPVELGLCLTDQGTTVLEAVRLLPEAAAAAAPAALAATEKPLLQGGQAACLGVASGSVILVDETTPAADFPFGAIAVARSASPVLAPLLRRAAAMVTEVGDAAGHLAAVAREFRVPTLFGMTQARSILQNGMLVTVDAETGTVRPGVTETHLPSESALSPEDPEYLALRRLLRLIAPLHLTDPDAPNFSAEGCLTLHDILHFAHDRAVAVLADLRLSGVSGQATRPLSLPIPLDLRVLDIGGGLSPGTEGLAAVRSRPLLALLRGMLVPGLWDTTPAPARLSDILGAMTRPIDATQGNLAIAARAYCNVSLRLGYHFTVIDAYVDRNPEKNTIYFRFVGGMANAAGREARAQFVRHVLARHDFKVEMDGDLLVARLKLIEAVTADNALRLLGSLCAFARQRDTGLPDAASLETAFRAALDAAQARQDNQS